MTGGVGAAGRRLAGPRRHPGQRRQPARRAAGAADLAGVGDPGAAGGRRWWWPLVGAWSGCWRTERAELAAEVTRQRDPGRAGGPVPDPADRRCASPGPGSPTRRRVLVGEHRRACVPAGRGAAWPGPGSAARYAGRGRAGRPRLVAGRRRHRAGARLLAGRRRPSWCWSPRPPRLPADASARRTVGILWDVGTFWPRAAHPFAPALLRGARRAGPDLADRAPGPSATGGRLVLSGHSQGTVLAAAAVWQLARPTRGRVALLTYGSPLERLYGRWFPGVLRAAGAWRRCTASVHGWRNLWRRTDPIGGPVRLPGADGPRRWTRAPAGRPAGLRPGPAAPAAGADPRPLRLPGRPGLRRRAGGTAGAAPPTRRRGRPSTAEPAQGSSGRSSG